jgi:hypothetical protein
MTAPISDYVDVEVTTESAAVQAPGFGKGLILQTHFHWTDRTREYSAASQMLTDGFLATEAAYLAAVAYFSQEPAPRYLKVGRRHADAVNVAIVVVNSAVYTVTINGTAYTYTADANATEQEIVDGLIAAIAASAVTGSDGGANTLTITADVSGTPFSLAVGANLTVGTPTAAETIGAALDAILLIDTDFYGVALMDRLSADMQAGATWVSANKRLLFAMTAEANVIGVAPGSDTTTLPAILKAASYDRVLCLYHASGATNFIDVAAMAWVLSKDPGSYTFALKTLIGITASNLTPTQRGYAKTKRAVTYESIGNQINGASNGVVSSGKNVDQIHGRDWMAAQIQTMIFALLASVNKVPFTDDGIGQIEQKAKQAGALGVSRDYLASYETDFPLRSEISDLDAANRVLDGASLTGVESGAIETVVTFNLIVQV